MARRSLQLILFIFWNPITLFILTADRVPRIYLFFVERTAAHGVTSISLVVNCNMHHRASDTVHLLYIGWTPYHPGNATTFLSTIHSKRRSSRLLKFKTKGHHGLLDDPASNVAWLKIRWEALRRPPPKDGFEHGDVYLLTWGMYELLLCDLWIPNLYFRFKKKTLDERRPKFNRKWGQPSLHRGGERYLWRRNHWQDKFRNPKMTDKL